MKTKITGILFAIVLSCFLASFSKPQSCTVALTNAKTNKSIKICDKNSVQKIEAVLGGAISLDKEIHDAKEEPVYTFVYDGLVIELQNDMIRTLTITNKKWKLNTLTTGMSLEQIATKFERLEFNYLGHPRFKVNDSKAVLYTETDQKSIVKKIGIVFL